MRAELPLRGGEGIEDGAIQRRVVGHDVAEQSGGGTWHGWDDIDAFLQARTADPTLRVAK